jgi:cell division protein FtsN
VSARRGGNSRQAVRAGTRAALPGWLWLLFGVLLGLAFSGIAIWRDWVPGPRQAATVNEAAPDLSAEEPPPVTAPAPAPTTLNPDFDFYTVLPEMQVVVPERELPKSRDPAAAPAALKPEFRYFLQLGAFANAADADGLKARAALAGAQAQVQRVSVDEKTFHRVRLGPFDDAQALEKARAQLDASGLSAVPVREKR